MMLATYSIHRTRAVAPGLLRSCAAVAFLLVTLLAGVAHAADPWDPLFETDRKTFPATMCRPVVGTSGILRYEVDGSLVNDSTTQVLHVACPLIRDATITTLSEYFSVYLVDQNPTQNFKCTASAHEPFGETVAQFGQNHVKFSSGSSSAVQKLDLITKQQATEGYSVLNCGIPPRNPSSGARSRINVYALEEVSAYADESTDSKSYPGLFAEQFLVLAPQSGLEYAEDGSATRTPGEELAFWYMPLVRDVVASDWNRIRMRVFDDDAAPDFDFACILSAYTETGEPDGELSGFCEQEVEFGETTIECTPLLLGLSPTTDDGPYGIFCLSVPQESSMFMYDIREE